MATGEAPHWNESSLAAGTAGSTVEAVGGAAALVLAILGLAAVLPKILVAVATIAVGVALLAEGAAIAGRTSRLASQGAVRGSAPELGGGMSAEFLGGASGIVLGVLALLNVAPLTLPAVAAVVFGGALLFGSGANVRIGTLASRAETGLSATREAVQAASGAQIMVGLASIVLGILALVGTAPVTLTLVALLSVGTGIVLGGTAITARMAALMRT